MSTAIHIKPGDYAEFSTIRVVDAYQIQDGKYAGMVRIEYARPQDGVNAWRIYPADHEF